MLRAGSGAVVVSAGAIGTPRVLFKSGIGPRDQVGPEEQAVTILRRGVNFRTGSTACASPTHGIRGPTDGWW